MEFRIHLLPIWALEVGEELRVAKFVTYSRYQLVLIQSIAAFEIMPVNEVGIRRPEQRTLRTDACHHDAALQPLN